MNTNRFRKSAMTVILLAIAAMIVQLPFMAPRLDAQANLRQPTVSSTGLLNLTWTAGVLNNGGKAVAIVAGTTNATASRTDCAAPLYATCGWLYANSSGTVANTTTLATAAASGNSIMAMYETNGTAIVKLSFPLQNSGVGLAGLGVLTSPTLITPNIGAATGTSLDLTGSLDVGVAGTTVGTVVMSNATSGTITLTPTTGALGTVAATFPAASITVPGVVFTTGGTTSTFTPVTTSSTIKVAYGSVALVSGTPSAATITGISPAFTSTATYFCVATPVGNTATIAGTGIAVTLVSGSSITLTGPDTVTTVIEYMCFGT